MNDGGEAQENRPWRKVELFDYSTGERQLILVCEIPEDQFPDRSFHDLEQLTEGVLRVLEVAARGSEYARLQAQAIWTVVFAKDLGVRKTKLKEAVRWRATPRAKAHSHLCCMLAVYVSNVMFPGQDVATCYTTAGRLPPDMPDSLITRLIRQCWKSRNNTPQSVAHEMYARLVSQAGIEPVDMRGIRPRLARHIKNLPLTACHYECAEGLRREGIDISGLLEV